MDAQSVTLYVLSILCCEAGDVLLQLQLSFTHVILYINVIWYQVQVAMANTDLEMGRTKSINTEL